MPDKDALPVRQLILVPAIITLAVTLLQLLTFPVAALGSLFVAMKGWPALGKTLVAYGLAARIPVVIVMLFAILGNWGTHYDVVPPGTPGFSAMGPIQKWFWGGLMAQLTSWMAFTVIFGMISGGLVAAARARKRPVTV